MQVTTETGALIQSWMDAQRYAPSWARLAANVGVSRQTVRNWAVAMRSLPEARHLSALASEIDQPYPVVLRAALRDAGYLKAEALDLGVGSGVPWRTWVLRHDSRDIVSQPTGNRAPNYSHGMETVITMLAALAPVWALGGALGGAYLQSRTQLAATDRQAEQADKQREHEAQEAEAERQRIDQAERREDIKQAHARAVQALAALRTAVPIGQVPGVDRDRHREAETEARAAVAVLYLVDPDRAEWANEVLLTLAPPDDSWGPLSERLDDYHTFMARYVAELKNALPGLNPN